ncbi:PIN domain-containing protein [Dellaglioa sp. BT-FLS60]
MRRNIIKGVIALVGGGIGVSLLPLLWKLVDIARIGWLNNGVVNFLVGVVLAFILSFFLITPLEKLLTNIESYLTNQSPMMLLTASVSTIVGMVIAILVSTPFYRSEIWLLNTIVPVLLLFLLGYFGFVIGTNRLEDWRKLFTSKNKKNDVVESSLLDRNANDNYHEYKILDTNILIDGRIYDLIKTGFIEGTLLVPNFVLYELQYIADSADSIKRVRGRRGLDILNKLQDEKIIPIEMYEGDFADIEEVDSKLIKLAKTIDGVIVTNDFNLNKVSEFQNVQILNVNALAKSLKPRVIPGEQLRVVVIKNGSERQQGVAYLDDGTMVVVEEGKYFLNKTIDVVVTSALQTDAGRMIFAKPLHSMKKINDKK